MSENGKLSNGDTDVSLDLGHPRDPNGNASDRSIGVVAKSSAGFNTLLAATFVVFLGYGTVLPILPLFLDRVLAVTIPGDVSLHTGLLTGVYTLALFGFAPLWGSLSDRLGRRPVLLWGLAGFALAMLGFSLTRNLPLAYGVRALAGAFAAAVIPVALAQAAECDDATRRARRFAWLSAASTLGFLSGPMLSGWLASIPMVMPQSEMLLGGPVAWPFVVTAGLAGAVWLLLYHHVREQSAHRPPADEPAGEPASPRAIGGFLTLTLLAMLGLGAFEVGLSLQARQSIGLDPFRVGLLFTECSLVMLAVQLLWSAYPPKRLSPGHLIGGAFLLMAGGILGLPYASGFWEAFVVVGLLGAGSGLLIPLLAYQVSLASGPAQGAALGKQTALASLGQAVGSAGAGMLFVGSALGTYWGLAVVLFVTAIVTFVVHYHPRVIALVKHAPRQD
ncbi:MFS transporter [Modicisalibacter xianhensis]|uniref:Predicted arabinose efflux permease, MFS family n=1 Tax=Modicisalibacter xianhensis TaxID=442341 RepID=A0A1I3EP57_9GAMM|nr:MFS transporter [Halomonas xianhensis]SFI00610.1 Predicted arabinose efflux permease, MFS family [Halomonas xianhensis]